VTTPLTDREGEILGLIARGLTNREIAEQIYLSVRTVEWHRSRLAAKLGVSSRSELVAMARGLLP
jgi:DNA-binding CsgD family transcriptional regulator